MLDQGTEKSQYEEPQIKIVMLGNEISGKTSIAQKFTQDTFPTQYEQTLGLDFYSKRILNDLLLFRICLMFLFFF